MLTDSYIKSLKIGDKKRHKDLYGLALVYHQPELMPTWAMLEELSLGELPHFYKVLAKDKDKKKVVQAFGLYLLNLRKLASYSERY